MTTNQPPLNLDGIEAAAKAICGGDYYGVPDDEMDYAVAHLAITAYLATAQPVVTSAEELDALPVGSLIMMSGVVAPFLHTDDGWESTRTPGKPVWDYTTNPSYLPARVLYRPEVNDA